MRGMSGSGGGGDGGRWVMEGCERLVAEMGDRFRGGLRLV